MQSNGSHTVSTLSEMDRHSSSLKARKMASTGGNRSWSEEEENYLLQTRMQKMPYKHIAAHLKKTELACRLHYHQLSHGSHRRKRTSSVSSSASSTSIGQSPDCIQYTLHNDHDSISEVNSSRHGSPISYSASPIAHHNNLNTSPSHGQHKVLLPKPRPYTPHGSPEPHGLRINTSEAVVHPSVVDTARLRAIYETRRAAFWAQIAAEYGNNVSPAHLEQIWREGAHVARPPTPDASPDGSIMSYPMLKPSAFPYPSASATEPSKTFSPVHQISAVSAPDRMAYVLPTPVPSGNRSRTSTWSSSSNVPIAALLTEDKDPRGEDVTMRD